MGKSGKIKKIECQKSNLKFVTFQSKCSWLEDGFFGGGQGSNFRPCIYYALSLPTELSSRGQLGV